MTIRRALLFVLGVLSFGLLTMALAKHIDSVPSAWLIGYKDESGGAEKAIARRVTHE